jgi:hypothetical protein
MKDVNRLLFVSMLPSIRSHQCDGACDGTVHQSGSRMATMVIYCNIPDRGGHTQFQNANIHIKPAVGSAVFFSYFDPGTKEMDKSLTQHSGCPVYEGEKKIITQWVRYGVTKETSWTSFNTCKSKESNIWCIVWSGSYTHLYFFVISHCTLSISSGYQE